MRSPKLLRLRWLLLTLALLSVLQRGLLPAMASTASGNDGVSILLCHAGHGDPNHPPASGDDCDDGCCNCLSGLDTALPGDLTPQLPVAPQSESPQRRIASRGSAPRWRYREPPGQAPPMFPA